MAGLMYLSFADDDGWLGGVVIEAGDIVEAAQLAALQGINPGGEVLGAHVPEEAEEAFRPYMGRLLSLADVQAIDGPLSN